jgi:hypothetical protein
MSSLLDRLETGNGEVANWIRAHLDFPHKSWCLIWPFARSDTGYAVFGNPMRKVHRLMCEHRHGPAPSPQHHAAHSCDRGHEGCVNPWHVDWKTASENQFDRRRNGLHARYKLTPEQAKEIRELKGLEHTKDTAARYGIRESNVRLIQSGKTWKKDRIDFRIFTEEEVAAIRNTPWQVKSAKQWAAELGATRSAIDRIRAGITYRYYPMPSEKEGSEVSRPHHSSEGGK